jgi:CRISPR-associated protein Cas2
MRGYGHWQQLSVFQCRLTARRRAELARRLEEVIHAHDDHVLFLDLVQRTRWTLAWTAWTGLLNL